MLRAFIEEAIPHLESICPEIGSDKWLMGTDDLTLMDTRCGAMWDFFYLLAKTPAFSDAAPVLDLENKAPKFLAYVERLRAHPKL